MAEKNGKLLLYNLNSVQTGEKMCYLNYIVIVIFFFI